jgi:hypothetical protein
MPTPKQQRRRALELRRAMIKCVKIGSARPTINCTAMTARMSPGIVEPTGNVASNPRNSMTMPNERCCKVDVSQPTVK